MIRFTDALTLAVTKLRTRKLRLAVTVVTASLLISNLVFGIFVVRGIVDSTTKFTSSGLANRYIVNATQNTDTMLFQDPGIIGRATEIHTKLVSDKKAEAKRLGVDYDASSEPKPVEVRDGVSYLDLNSPSATKALDEYYAAQPSQETVVKDAAKNYNPVATYTFSSSTIDGTARDMADGSEPFVQSKVERQMTFEYKPKLSQGWQYVNTSVVESFMLSESQLAKQKNTRDIPIIAPYSEVEKAVGFEPLPATATHRDKRDRIAQVRDRASSATFTICYRNAASLQQIEDAIRVAKEVEDNKSNKEYQKPDLIYGLPASDSCGAAIVVRDVRTKEQKASDTKTLEFNRKFDTQADPVQQKVTFRVVGVAPDAPSFDDLFGVQTIVQFIAGSTLQGTWVVPESLYDSMPNKGEYEHFRRPATQATPGASMTYIPVGTLVEFKNPEDAQAFYTEKNCPAFECYAKSGSINLSFFGSNSIVIKEMEKALTVFLQIAGAIIVVIAGLIMMGLIGRIMTDSRRETAVFRAIGATRADISAVYSTYTLLLCLIVAAVSIAIGSVLAFWLNSALSPDASIHAQLAFGTNDERMDFVFFGLWPLGLVAVVIFTVLVGFAGMLLPLLRNLRRNPINDMRDDR